MGEGDTLVNAVVGAIVTVLLSFTAVSPILGGGVAGYLQRGEPMDGARVGAISGAIATIPFALFLWIVFGLFFAGPAMGGMGPEMGIPGAFGVFALFVLLAGFLWSVVLSGVGGFLGAYLATETDVGGSVARTGR